MNEFLETDIPEVWAAGDLANYPDRIFAKRRRVEHWDNAVEQGRVAVANMMGKPQPFIHVPYFFSDIFELSYEFWGDPESADEVIYRGSVNRARFSAWWLRKKRLVSALVLNRPEEEREWAPRWIMGRCELDAARLREAQSPLKRAVIS